MRIFLLTMMAILMAFSLVVAQTLDDYVLETKGDTLVVKDFIDMGNQPGSLDDVMALDDAAPAGRVYELKANGYYPMASGIQTPARPIMIGGRTTHYFRIFRVCRFYDFL